MAIYMQEYQWACAPAFEWGNIATVGLFRMFRPRRPSSAEYCHAVVQSVYVNNHLFRYLYTIVTGGSAPKQTRVYSRVQT